MAETYKLSGHKSYDVKTLRLADGTEVTKGGDAVEIPEAELTKLKSEGFKFRASSDTGDDNEDGGVKTPADQLKAQAPVGAPTVKESNPTVAKRVGN